MPRLRRLSGRDIVSILGRFGFRRVAQRGSHMKLARASEAGTETLTVPLHDPLDPGTLRAIMRQAERFVAASELRPHFYSD